MQHGNKKKIVHIITAVNLGGAEMMLYHLLVTIDTKRFDCYVISLRDIGEVGKKIQALGIPVLNLNMRQGIPSPFALGRMVRYLLKIHPDLIQTWMYHANLMGGLAALFLKKCPIVWGLHHSNLSPSSNKRTTLWVNKLCALLSKKVPQKVVCCSEATRITHVECGYDQSKMVTIPIGFDLGKLYYRETASQAIRNKLKISPSVDLIGMIARFHPQKDHLNFIRAAAIFHQKHPHTHFLLCGKEIDEHNTQLTQWIHKSDLSDVVHLLGECANIPEINSALNIATLSSCGEGFPTVIGEAMACETPCIATDVGDVRTLIGDTGFVVPPQNPESLASAWERMLQLPEEKRQEYGKNARQRIITHYALPAIVAQYQTLYSQLIQ
ncbi:glycosyltransferase [Deltaproteobacteria bacterium TL4]